MAINTWAIEAKFPKIKQVGLCHSVQGTAEELAQFDPAHVQFSFFIVGYDQVSMGWLRDNLEALERNYALGLVVNVETPEQLEALYALTENRLVLTPASGETLASSVHLRHYPAYVDNKRGLLR